MPLTHSGLAQQAIEYSPQPVLWADSKAKIIFSNKAASQLLGYSTTRLQQLTLFELAPDLDLTEWSDLWNKLANGTPRAWQCQLVHQTGVCLTTTLSAAHAYNKAEPLVWINIAITDTSLTDQSSTANMLAQFCMGTGISLWDWQLVPGQSARLEPHATINGQNQGIFGGTSWLELVHHGDHRQIQQAFTLHLSGGSSSYQSEFRLRGEDGDWHWILSRGKVVERDDEGHPTRIMGINLDITDRQKQQDIYDRDRTRLEEQIRERTRSLTQTNEAMLREIRKCNRVEDELRKAKTELEASITVAREKAAEAQRAYAAKNEFLATISHELRTPLNGVIGMIELLEESQLSPEQREFLAIMQTQGDTLLTIINDILDFSRIESGHLELGLSSFDLADELQNILRLTRSAAMRKGLSLTLRQNGSLTRKVICDKIRLRQVIINLINNAIKFTQRGNINLALEQQLSDDGRAEVKIAVHDTGVGIPEDDQETIFKAFKQADGGLTRSYGGTGLGLAISKQIVTLLGGNIWVESKVGEGSSFFVTLTLDLEPQQTSKQALPSGNGNPDADHHRERVLLVEDYPVNQQLIKIHLSRAGFRVILANNGEEAIDLFKQSGVDLILMDLQMPVMDGLCATRLIRAFETEKARTPIPIIALTAAAFEKERQRCQNAGMNDLLTKPIKKRELLSMVTQWLTVGKAMSKPPQEGRKDAPIGAIDFDSVLAEFDNDHQLVLEVMQQFSENLHKQLISMRHALAARKFAELSTEAHAIKGGAANLMVHALADAASALDKAAKRQALQECRAHLSEITRQLDDFEEQLTQITQAWSQPPPN